jgi:hypothetical protein
LNKTRAEEVGLAPLKEVLDQFDGWPIVVGDSWNDRTFVWTYMIYKFHVAGYSIDYFVDFRHDRPEELDFAYYRRK